MFRFHGLRRPFKQATSKLAALPNGMAGNCDDEETEDDRPE
jgi:hypothetical protein